MTIPRDIYQYHCTKRAQSSSYTKLCKHDIVIIYVCVWKVCLLLLFVLTVVRWLHLYIHTHCCATTLEGSWHPSLQISQPRANDVQFVTPNLVRSDISPSFHVARSRTESQERNFLLFPYELVSAMCRLPSIHSRCPDPWYAIRLGLPYALYSS